jgi:hypothetical protein
VSVFRRVCQPDGKRYRCGYLLPLDGWNDTSFSRVIGVGEEVDIVKVATLPTSISWTAGGEFPEGIPDFPADSVALGQTSVYEELSGDQPAVLFLCSGPLGWVVF